MFSKKKKISILFGWKSTLSWAMNPPKNNFYPGYVLYNYYLILSQLNAKTPTNPIKYKTECQNTHWTNVNNSRHFMNCTKVLQASLSRLPVKYATAIGVDKGGFPVNIFLISPQKHMLWVLITRQGTSNEYPQHMFLWRNKKNINTFGLKKVPLLVLWQL